MATESDDKWALYYWPGHIAGPGRAEFARLIFLETDTPWEEPQAKKSMQECLDKMKSFRKDKPGCFAYPAVHDKENDFFLTQTSIICRYLATKLGGGRLLPSNEIEQFEASMLMSNIVDVLTEGEFSWHPLKRHASYNDQKEEAAPFIKEYREVRLPEWLETFETRLVKKTNPLYLVGDKLSYVDLALWFALDGNEVECPDSFKSVKTPLLDKFRENIGSLPRMKAWSESHRRSKFTMTGPCF